MTGAENREVYPERNLVRRPPFDVIAIATSAGGVDALIRVLEPLPADFPVPIMIAQHMGRRKTSLLAEILARNTAIPVLPAAGGEQMLPGSAYVAPPGHHLLTDGTGTLHLSEMGCIGFVRPSADLMLHSLALGFRERGLGVILTGAGEDGAAGVRLLKSTGGTVIAQDPTSALHPQMPVAAIRTGCVDFVLPLNGIGAALITLAAVPGAASWFGIPSLQPTSKRLLA